MDERAKIPVTLPRDSPTVSYWQDPPDATISDLRSTPTLPSSTDVVIIGSGITGAGVAWNLLQANPNLGVVMLEARQACSGATGRNGGHTKAASYRSFLDHASQLGTAAAVQIAKLELANIQAVHAFAKEHNIDCDLNECDTIDVIYDPAQWVQAHEAVSALRAALPEGDPVARYTFYTPEQVAERFYCHDYENKDGEKLCGGVQYFAGSLSAYKFGIGVLKLCLQLGLNLQTNTAATAALLKDGDGWVVQTPRGSITAKKVVLATNGYTARLLPEMFQGVIVPLRGQIQAHRPGSGMPEKGCLPTTYSFIYPQGYEYMIPRPKGSKFEGDIVMGGGLVRAPDDGLLEYGTTDDTSINKVISEYLRDSTLRYFGRDWGEDHLEGRVRRQWTGVMGFSPDGFPFVGEVPDHKGLWVSASFQGHGMVLCWMCARALVAMMGDRDGEELTSWFPDIFRVNKERMGKRFEGRLHTAA
ncbi:putative fad dependent oxidoreductase [Diplogelasinospora grovesii]|uniref:Fad dependent oxidoreductase n=1 Tax=Diplogelasinospora grovesii TaxID=303347 RepID=A0AAN6S9R7_9PEZI|nr:putative fad dependent oxidoreductase [Diplogelasinospora grovesii]